MSVATPGTSVDPVAARAALASVVPRLTALIRSIDDPGAHAVGEWTAGDVAVHLAHAWERLPALARGDAESPLREPGELAALTTSLVREEQGRDLEATARRIEAAATAFLSTPVTDEGRPWRIDPTHAGMAIMGFLFRALSVVDPRFPVRQRQAAGVRACFDIRVRRTGRVNLVLDDGALTIEPPSGRRVDCHLSAEPATLFLLIWAHAGQWPGVLTGRLSLWGRRPGLGARLPGMLRNP